MSTSDLKSLKRYIVKKPYVRTYKRNNIDVRKTFHTHHCSFCAEEGKSWLTIAAHIDKKHQDKLSMTEKKEVKEADKVIDEKVAAKEIPKHTLSMQEIPQPSSQQKEKPTESSQSSRPERSETSFRSAPPEKDDWLDFFDA